MAIEKLRKPVDTLLKAKAELDKKMTSISDHYTSMHEQLVKLRNEQACNREAKATLPNTAQHKPARQVLDQSISSAQLDIERVQKDLEQVDKDRVVVGSKLKALQASIIELQRAV